MKTTQNILDEREQQYGSYDSFAKIYGGLRKVSDQHAEKLTWPQQAAVEWYYLNWQDIAGYAMLGGNIYTPKLPDNAQGLPKPLTDSIYPESHLNKNSVWRLDLEFETKEEAVAVLEALSGKIFES